MLVLVLVSCVGGVDVGIGGGGGDSGGGSSSGAASATVSYAAKTRLVMHDKTYFPGYTAIPQTRGLIAFFFFCFLRHRPLPKFCWLPCNIFAGPSCCWNAPNPLLEM